MENSQLQFRKNLGTARRKQIQTGYDRLVAARKKNFIAAQKSIQQLSKTAGKEFKALTTIGERKRGQQLLAGAKMEFTKALLKQANGPDHLITAPIAKRIKTSYGRGYKNVSQIMQLRKRFAKGLGQFTGNFHSQFSVLDDRLNINLLDLVQIENPNVGHFLPPYEFAEINNNFETSTDAGNHAIADPNSGFLSLGLVFSAEHTPLFDWFNAGLFHESFHGVGISFTMPAAGRLKVTALMLNIDSLMESSIHDHFGFSDASISMNAGIYLNVLHPNNVNINEVTMSSFSLTSDGDDVSRSQTDLQTSLPFVVELKSSGAFAAGETLQIVVGAKFLDLIFLDDMSCRNRVRISWQVREIFVEVV